ncbi:hypothetical protein MNB_SM-5-1277 [hydrothermal vent metagenome]|uniref:Uncharacterized protein n=1 Tax=hydrothermal vent metagenome TaxID=652676 RepID=A0A1W1CYE9_9ZZZZ
MILFVRSSSTLEPFTGVCVLELLFFLLLLLFFVFFLGCCGDEVLSLIGMTALTFLDFIVGKIKRVLKFSLFYR